MPQRLQRHDLQRVLERGARVRRRRQCADVQCRQLAGRELWWAGLCRWLLLPDRHRASERVLYGALPITEPDVWHAVPDTQPAVQQCLPVRSDQLQWHLCGGELLWHRELRQQWCLPEQHLPGVRRVHTEPVLGSVPAVLRFW
jgi:hypothetical protein